MVERRGLLQAPLARAAPWHQAQLSSVLACKLKKKNVHRWWLAVRPYRYIYYQRIS